VDLILSFKRSIYKEGHSELQKKMGFRNGKGYSQRVLFGLVLVFLVCHVNCEIPSGGDDHIQNDDNSEHLYEEDNNPDSQFHVTEGSTTPNHDPSNTYQNDNENLNDERVKRIEIDDSSFDQLPSEMAQKFRELLIPSSSSSNVDPSSTDSESLDKSGINSKASSEKEIKELEKELAMEEEKEKEKEREKSRLQSKEFWSNLKERRRKREEKQGLQRSAREESTSSTSSSSTPPLFPQEINANNKNNIEIDPKSSIGNKFLLRSKINSNPNKEKEYIENKKEIKKNQIDSKRIISQVEHLILGTTFSDDLDLDSVFKLTFEASEMGDPTAQFLLGVFYSSSILPNSYSKQVSTNDTLKQSQAKALLNLYFSAEDPFPISSLDGDDSTLLEKEDSPLSVASSMSLAYRYNIGISVSKSCELSSKYYRIVASKVIDNYLINRTLTSSDSYKLGGDSGSMFTNKRATEVDIIEYHQHAADNGDTHAQMIVGRYLMTGAKRSEIDPNLAVKYLLKAASTGESSAYGLLGQHYLSDSTRKNVTKAIEYWKLG